jgi:hypothetical protein
MGYIDFFNFFKSLTLCALPRELDKINRITSRRISAMKASLFTAILATTVLSGHAAFAAANGLYKHDSSIAQYSYSVPIIDTSASLTAPGTSLRDDMDKGYKPEPAAAAPALQPATAGSGYKPSVPAPTARQPGSGYKPSVPAPAVISPRVEAAPKAAPAMPTPAPQDDIAQDSNDGTSAAAAVKGDANTNINSNVTSSAKAAPLATPADAAAKQVTPSAAMTKPVAPSANNAAFGNVLNPVPATPATAPVTTNTPAPATVAPAPQSSATPPAAPATTGTSGITVSGTGTSTPASGAAMGGSSSK